MTLAPPTPLAATHDLTRFDSGSPLLDQWLRTRAWKNESRYSRSFVVCDGDEVAGFYCLSAGSVERAAAPGNLRRNAPGHVPVAILGRLAVARGYQGRGLGADLLADAIRRVAKAGESIAISALLVQAKDDAARRFYMRCAEFQEFPGGSGVLFLPLPHSQPPARPPEGTQPG